MESEKIECTDAILETLNSYGVDYIFSSPGSEWPPIWEALARNQAEGKRAPRYVNCRHEELAVSAAVACARMTRKLTAVFLHTTVGTLHGSMSIRMAYHYEVPLVIIAGESNTFGEGSIDPGAQWLGHLADLGGPSGLVKGIVKWAETVDNPETLAGMLEHACEISISRMPGPTFLTIPLEVMLQTTGNVPQIRRQRKGGRSVDALPLPNPDLLDEVTRLLLASHSPLIVTEHLGREPEAVRSLVNLAEFLSIPVVEAQSPSCMNFPRDHPLHLGFDAKPLLKGSDLVLLVGVEGPWHPSSKRSELGRVILIDEDTVKPRVPIWDYKVDLRVGGTSLGLILSELLKNVESKSESDNRHHSASMKSSAIKERKLRFKEAHDRMVQELVTEARKTAESKPIDTRWACYVLGKVLPKNAIIVEELTTHRRLVNRLTFLNHADSYFQGHVGGLGTGLCFALGAKLVSKNRPVVALLGDGAMSYNPALACMGFAAEHDTPILVVVFNNKSYDAMKQGLLRYYPSGWASKTEVFHGPPIEPSPNYVGVMKAMGGYGERVENPAVLEDALRRSLKEVVEKDRMALVDMILAPGAPR